MKEAVWILIFLSLWLTLNAMDYSVTLVAIGKVGIENFSEYEVNPIGDWIVERGLIWFPFYKLFLGSFIAIGFSWYQYNKKKYFQLLLILGLLNMIYLYVVVNNVYVLGWN